eukprot:550723-Amphidinium_carterae.1
MHCNNLLEWFREVSMHPFIGVVRFKRAILQHHERCSSNTVRGTQLSWKANARDRGANIYCSELASRFPRILAEVCLLRVHRRHKIRVAPLTLACKFRELAFSTAMAYILLPWPTYFGNPMHALVNDNTVVGH